MASGEQWFVVHTHPNGEVKAQANLHRQGFTTYLPRYQRLRRHARRKEVVARPLFPRYLFVLLDLARDQWRSIQSTFGVSSLVLVGDKPVAMPDEMVDEIRAREDANGFVVLGLPPGLRPGAPVRMIDGLFADHLGVLDGMAGQHRVSVLLSLLGRQVRVFVAPASIAVA